MSLFYVVVPSRTNSNATVKEKLGGEIFAIECPGGENFAIECPLRFGSLSSSWNVRWTAEDRHGNILSTGGYFTQTNPFLLVVKKVTINFEQARFKCEASRGGAFADSQYVTLQLFCK